MDGLFDDFDNDYDDGIDFDGDDGFNDDNFGDETDGEESGTESDDGSWGGPGERDWAIIFPLSEDIAREKREQDRIRRENDDADDDYWNRINRRW